MLSTGWVANKKRQEFFPFEAYGLFRNADV